MALRRLNRTLGGGPRNVGVRRTRGSEERFVVVCSCFRCVVVGKCPARHARCWTILESLMFYPVRRKRKRRRKKMRNSLPVDKLAGLLQKKRRRKRQRERVIMQQVGFLELLCLRDDGSPWLWTNRLKKKKERKRGNHCPSWWSKFASRLRKGVAQDAA